MKQPTPPPPRQEWIGTDSAKQAPLLRREFNATASLAKATLLISGLGYHEAWINGQRIGDHVLDPAQSDYELRIFYIRHDLTDMVQDGVNVLGVILGKGWYDQDRVWGANGLSYGRPRLMAELHLQDDDGTVNIIRADPQWRWAPGPITDNNVYAGECYDARKEVKNWCTPGLDDTTWAKAIPLAPPGGELIEQVMPPIRKTEELSPVTIKAIQPGAFVVDFGQNFAGWTRIQVQGPEGTEISLRSAERLFPDGSIDTSTTGVFATGVEQVDRYICKGGGTESWEPRFTYHGFRYVEVSGWPGKLQPEDFTGIVVHNDLPIAGAFESSDERLNQLHRMALWTHRSNMHGLPEDCPAREKCGWLGDANLVAEYSLWNYKGISFWQKFLGDIETSRMMNDALPGRVVPGKRCNQYHQPDWAAAYIMLPWYLYLRTGDSGIVKPHWHGMTELMTHFRNESEAWILPGGYGDYFDPGTDAIVMHTPPTLTTTLWFYRCADVMAMMADALGDAKAAENYRNWRENIAAALDGSFYDTEKGTFGSQTANTMAIAFRVCPDKNDRLMNALVQDIRSRGKHMNVGVMGVRFILEALTQGGHGELALVLMHQDSYPSFGYLIERGATTLWECWGEEAHDGTHGPRSLNHPFMGGYDNWFFNTLAGIRLDPKQPGFKHFFLEPNPIRGLAWVNCRYNCGYGRIESNWRVEKASFNWEFVIPPGTTATVLIPGKESSIEMTAGRHSVSQKMAGCPELDED